MTVSEPIDELASRLAAAGCVAAGEEAAMLREAAAGDSVALEAMVGRRLTGEPVEWIAGWAPFCGLRVALWPGVYVPRAQTEVLARRAGVLVAAAGATALGAATGCVAVDLATGCGAVAMVMSAAVPAGAGHLRVVATEVDPAAVACARANGIEVFTGDLDAPLPPGLAGGVDVLTANVPYVPTAAMALLPRDVVAYEPRMALDGGDDGLDLVRRVLLLAPRWLRPGGRLLVEIGPDQAEVASAATVTAGLVLVGLLADEDGDVRALEARLPD